jgi:hypothetical protein
MRLPWFRAMFGAALVLLPALLMAAEEAMPITIELKHFTFRSAEGKGDLFGYNQGEEKLFFYTNGTAEAKFKVPDDGAYEITIKASEDKALDEGAKFKVAVDGKQVGKETETREGDPKDYKFTTTLKSGEHKITMEFTNDVFKEGEYDRNLYIYAVSLKKVK